MESKDRKFSNFIGDLKASNIASNISSLDFYSQQICLLLDMIKTNNNSIAEKNIIISKKVFEQINEKDYNEIINRYIRFGDSFQIILSELKKTENLKYLKKIAIHYLDIAKLTRDERVKKLAFEIADSLSV